MKILIADDSSTMRKIVRGALKSGGYEDVIEASNGKEAVAAETGTPAESAEEAKIDVDQMPVPKTTVQPKYPEKARKAGIQGMVLLKVKVSETGSVESVQVEEGVEGHTELDEAAVEAVKQWSFEPAQKDGEPVAIEVAIPVQFRLADKK